MDLFYLNVVPVLGLACLYLVRLHQIKKHDRILLRFCRIRRDLMAYLREDGEELPFEEYVTARRLLELMNMTIHRYNDDKTFMFNMRAFEKFLKNYRKTHEQVDRIEATNERLEVISDDLADALTQAFFAYTPFLRVELGYKISLLCFKLMGRLGNEHASMLVKQIQAAFAFENQHKLTHNGAAA